MSRPGHDAAFSRTGEGVVGTSTDFDDGDNGLDPRDWLLECEGWRIQDENGRLIGDVVAPVYEPSARWDRPRALAVRMRDGVVEVPLSRIASVDSDDCRITVDNRRA